MAQPIVEARSVGKRYMLGAAGRLTFRESVIAAAKAPARWMRGVHAPKPEPFWALRDVSFDIAPGEAVGIIGRNGAGKSTLLKVLARITSPTTGEVRLRGQIAALLEVGTGFHSELSGRENIFLNGAIMGMSRAEVRAHFDEIVAFAEVERFLDTPVKRYSSGMYVRLAFAVASHLQPEILVVDEVLAVGDASFQKRCLGKMKDVASGGRTVLFVSHNLAAVSRLCSRGILLSNGGIVSDGAVSSVIDQYLSGSVGESPTAVDFARVGRFPGSDDVRLLGARIVGGDPNSSTVDIRKPIRVEMDYEVLRERHSLNPNVHVYNDESQCVFATADIYLPEGQRPRAVGRYRSTVTIPGNFLAEGMFSFDIAMSTMAPAVIIHFNERGLLSIHVHDAGEGDSVRGIYAGPFPGVVRPMLHWDTVPLSP